MPNINFTPSIKQFEAWQKLTDKTTTEIGYGGAAYSGKSYIMCIWLIIMSLQYAGTRWGFARRELKNLKRTTLATFFKVMNEWELKEGIHFKYNQQSDVITFLDTNSEIYLLDMGYKPSDPLFSRFGGLELTGAAVDESNECSLKSISILKTRLGRCKNAEHGIKLKMLETFNPDKGHVYQRFHKPEKDGTLPIHRCFIRALPTDNPMADPDYIEMLRNSDEITKQRLLLGNFDYDDNKASLMNYDSICDIFTNVGSKNGLKTITCDVARFGKDSSTIFAWDGWTIIDFKEVYKSSITELADEILIMRAKYSVSSSKILCDEDGVGGGLVDVLRERGLNVKGFINNSSPIKTRAYKNNFNNLKSQCIFYLADKVNKGEVAVDCVQKSLLQENLTRELEVVEKKNIEKDGKNAVITKEEMKEKLNKSPDYLDAAMMRAYFDLNNTDISWEIT